MSHGRDIKQLTRTALHSGDNDQVEREYDRLRDMARAEAEKRGSCFDRVRSFPLTRTMARH